MNSDLSYLGLYYIRTNKRLRDELATKVPGLGYKNVDYFLYSVLARKTKELKFSDLSSTEIDRLEKVVTDSELKVESSIYSNRKQRNVSSDYSQECVVSNESQIVLGSKLKSQSKLDIKRLAKMKCYVGIRHTDGLKVRGQRTQSTGRKNKQVKGFQKKKINTS